MNVILELSVIPVGVGVSISSYIAKCQDILKESGLNYQLHANGTNIEGEWDHAFAAVKRCHEVLHQMGAPRLSTFIKLGTRTDREQSLEGNVSHVEKKCSL